MGISSVFMHACEKYLCAHTNTSSTQIADYQAIKVAWISFSYRIFKARSAESRAKPHRMNSKLLLQLQIPQKAHVRVRDMQEWWKYEEREAAIFITISPLCFVSVTTNTLSSFFKHLIRAFKTKKRTNMNASNTSDGTPDLEKEKEFKCNY